jgi:2'-5' RNA ligase
MQKPENSTLINICVIPDERVSKTYVSISQSLKSDQTMFIIGNGKFAHMTVYMARFADEDISKVTASVAEALQQASPFQCVHTGYFMTEGRYLEASYRKSPEFTQLHELLITHTADLRINPGNPFNEGYFTPYTSEQKKNAEETGYDLARSLYRPHVTLTRYTEGGVPHAFPALPEADLSFQLSKVCIYKADDNGVVYELIEAFQVR